jgi:hypothetical protein
MKIEQIEKLKALNELKEKGVLTEEEFQTEKYKVMTSNELIEVTKSENESSNLIAIGYVMAVFPILILPIVFTAVGAAIGLINITKGKIGHGSAQIGISVFCGVVGAEIGGAGFGL